MSRRCWFLSWVLVGLISVGATAQPLSGIYTVGSGGNYGTLTAAVSDLLSRGVNSPVTFRLRTGTFNEQVIIGTVAGASATNTITFEAESGNPGDAVLTFSATAAGTNYIIRLDNAGFLTFRNLTLQPTGSSFNRAVQGVNALTNITFENLGITLPTTTSITEDRAAILLRPTTSSNVRLLNTVITGGSHGFIHVGNSTVANYSAGTVITGN
ncbi:MAG: hypothetical protein ACK51D_12805, partial [Cyclobacteriaceae bacterium]